MRKIHFVRMPIINLSTDAVFGYELLLRCFNGISLETFSENKELFEQYHRQLMEATFQLDTEGVIRGENTRLFLNMTPNQLVIDPLYESLSGLNHKAGGNLVIEITEDFLNYEYFRLKNKLDYLTRGGCELAITSAYLLLYDFFDI